MDPDIAVSPALLIQSQLHDLSQTSTAAGSEWACCYTERFSLLCKHFRLVLSLIRETRLLLSIYRMLDVILVYASQ